MMNSDNVICLLSGIFGGVIFSELLKKIAIERVKTIRNANLYAETSDYDEAICILDQIQAERLLNF